jgi:tetratricopeptide (TPR) repeat protein
VESTLQRATFPPEIRSEFKERVEGLSEAIHEVETSIREQQHRETFEEAQQLLEQATKQTASEQFEAAESNLQTAEEKLSTVESTVERPRVSSAEKRIERVRDDITAGSIGKDLDGVTVCVQRAQEAVEGDPELADNHISHARSQLTTAQNELEDSRISGKQRDLPARIEELWKSIEEVEHQVTVQEAQQTLGEAQDLINQADQQTELNQLEAATSNLQAAKNHIATAEPILDGSEIAVVEAKVEQVENDITVTSISNELDDIEDAVQGAEESLGTDFEATGKQLSQASSALETVDDRIDSELQSSEHKQPLIHRVNTLRKSIADAEHRIRVKKGEQSLAKAHNSLDAAQESIDALELRAVPSMVKSAQDRVKSITVTELEQEITAFHTEAASIRESLIEAKVTHALDQAQHELNRARGYLQHDVDDTRSRLRAVQNHLRAANILTSDDRLSPSVQEDFTEQIERYRSQVQTLVDRCQEQEITEAIDEAVAEIETVRGNFRSGAIEQAQGRVESAVARIQNVPDEAPEAEVDKLRDDLNNIQTKIIRYEIGEYITNAEETVNRAEAERAAGEETAAIEAYQQAISTYRAAVSDAQGASLPEAFEIKRRIEQLTMEIDSTRDQWVERRSMQIDRELRAGERAVAQGLEAASDADLEVAETKYDIAEEAAAGAREWLQETTDNPTGDELSLPSTLAAEYRSATSGLTGHLGYLRTQIDEATDTKTEGATSTPLAEYYDGLYAVYQAMPDTVHPLWQEALTTVLFGGDGLAESATEFGAQQSERNDTPISVLREEYGNGELITEFSQIDTASPRSKDEEFVEENQQLPVAPESKTVLPIDVDSTAVLDAIELLAEFPAVPEADYEGEEATELLKIDYFEDQFLDKQSVLSEERDNKDHSQKESVSNELATLQQELEAQISDS